MGGRGTYASKNNVSYTYEIDKSFDFAPNGIFNGIKIIKGMPNSKKHDLPVEAHSSKAYIQFYPDGNFKMLRFYDKDHYLTTEIGYHPEKELDPSRKPILHMHTYRRDNFKDRKPRLLIEDEYDKYKKYFRGVTRWKPEM